MTTTRHISLGFIAAAVVAGLAACGGGDDSNDGPQTSNLADCHNPSMYTVGSSWTVTSQSSRTYTTTAAQTVTEASEGTETVKVLAPPPEWGMPVGVVRILRDPGDLNHTGGSLPDWTGTYVRVAGDVLETTLSVSWMSFAAGVWQLNYRGYVPGLAAPISLAAGQTYTSPAVQTYQQFATTSRPDPITDPGRVTYSYPPISGGQTFLPERVSSQLTYVGRETITVPAGTFATCHISTPSGNYQAEEWRVAEGPYKGVVVKSRSTATGFTDTSTSEAKQISASWK